MTLRGFMFFLMAFTTVIVLGLLTGCSSSDYLQHVDVDRTSSNWNICGFARCDGKARL